VGTDLDGPVRGVSEAVVFQYTNYKDCGRDVSLKMQVDASTASGLGEIHISGSQWACGGKGHPEEVLGELSFVLTADDVSVIQLKCTVAW
jgi:hypothetical protein